MTRARLGRGVPHRAVVARALADAVAGSTGTLARANANDTLAAVGTTTPTGTLARTNANDSVVASGTSAIGGTLARTNANDSVAGSGTTTPTGTLARTNANDTAAGSGTAGSPTGTVAYTNANDTVSASGTTPGSSSTGAGRSRPTKRRARVVEIDGVDHIVNSAQEAQALLDQAQAQAEETAALAVERASKTSPKKPLGKVMRDARKTLAVPEVTAPAEFQGMLDAMLHNVQQRYAEAAQTIEIAALLRKAQQNEQDDEDILMMAL
jgi:hypothetical protein